MSIPVYKNLIAGEWVASRSGKTFLNINPARNTDVVGEFPSSNARDVDDAVGGSQESVRQLAAVSRSEARRDSLPRRRNSLVSVRKSMRAT